MYSMEKLARGIGRRNEEIDPRKLQEYERVANKKLQETIDSLRGRDVWPHNQYFVNCDKRCERARGPIYRSKK